MFEPEFEKRAKRKRRATEALENRLKRANPNTLSSRWTKQLHYWKRLDSQGSSRKARDSPVSLTSRRRNTSEDRQSRRSKGVSRADSRLETRRSKHRGKAVSSRRRQDDRSRRRGFASSNTNNSDTRASLEDVQEIRQARSQELRLFQDAKEKTTDLEPAEKFQRSHPLAQYLLEPETIRHELTHPAIAEGVEVVYTKNELEAERWLRAHIVDCSARAVGFDTEQKPQFVSKKKGGTENELAVLQLAVEKSCLVLHVYYIGELPKSLESILRDENILKIGSGVDKDASKLTQERGLVCNGLKDTQDMAASLGLQKTGLKALAERFLDIELDKVVALTNWEQFPLQLRQIEYAALDAWVSLKVYHEMKRQKKGSKDFKATSNLNQGILAQIMRSRQRKENEKRRKNGNRKF